MKRLLSLLLAFNVWGATALAGPMTTGAGRYPAAVSSASTWDAATFPAGVTALGGNNAIADYPSGSDGHFTFWGTAPLVGKPYFEVICTLCSADHSFGVIFEEIGIANASQANTDYLGHNTTSGGYRGAGSPGAGTLIFNFGSQGVDPACAFTQGNTVGVAVDVPNKKLWFTIDGSTWCGSTGADDPVAGTGGMDLSAVPVTTPWFPAATINTAPGRLTLKTGGGFTFAIPTGFTAAP